MPRPLARSATTGRTKGDLRDALPEYEAKFGAMHGAFRAAIEKLIDVAHLESYKSALKEEVTASVRLEPGVLTLYAVFEKDRPTHVTILEIYADRAAYEQHIKSSHFLKYKTGTEQMVKSLDLIDAIPLVPEMKIK
jgi:quinol monooxygenase YgiN